MLRLSASSSCCYQQCDQDGHSVCPVCSDHYSRLIAAAKALCGRLGTPDAEALAQGLMSIVNETTEVQQ